jgi:hypothetical protein
MAVFVLRSPIRVKCMGEAGVRAGKRKRKAAGWDRELQLCISRLCALARPVVAKTEGRRDGPPPIDVFMDEWMALAT